MTGSGGRAALSHDPLTLAELAADAATATVGVRKLELGRGLSTFGRGRRVDGVRVAHGEEGWTVHLRVVVEYGTRVREVGDAVRAAVVAALPVRAAVHCVVADVAPPSRPTAGPRRT